MKLLLFAAAFAFPLLLPAAEPPSAPVPVAPPFEIREGDRVLFLGDTLLEREGTYGYLETRMHEQFPDRHFTVRNLAFSGDTPLGWSRASFDPPAKGFELLKEQIAMVKPTVVFLGYGMAASLQELTDKSADITLNPDKARYGAEPMSAARFKKELAQLMDAIEAISGKAALPVKTVGPPATTERSSAPPDKLDDRAKPPGVPANEAEAKAAAEGKPKTANPPPPPAITPPGSGAKPARDASLTGTDGKTTPSPAASSAATTTGEAAALSGEKAKKKGWNFEAVDGGGAAATGVRFVLLSPIRHEDLRAVKPGLPDPAPHNALLEQYSKAIEELATERRANFVSLATVSGPHEAVTVPTVGDGAAYHSWTYATENGIHLTENGNSYFSHVVGAELNWEKTTPAGHGGKWPPTGEEALRAAVVAKNALFFHRWRPENSTYLFGFRKHEQGRNAKEISQFDPLIEKAEAEIDRLKKSNPQISQISADKYKGTASAPAAKNLRESAKSADQSPTQPLPQFDVAEGLEITLWAENPLLEKPTQMNWDAQGRLWVASSGIYPQIAPGEPPTDRVIILEDTDRDGKADKATTFAEGLLIPTGVEADLGEGERRKAKGEAQADAPEAPDQLSPSASRPSPSLPASRPSPFLSACYVGQSTELLHFSDTDGDGTADTKRIVLSGFGTEDTHHILHTLRWGPDGRLYFNQSIYIHSHLETPWGMVRMNSGAVMAYDPRTERVEVLFKGFCNPWGHAWDKWGQSFITDGAGNQGISWGILGAEYFTYERARQIAPSISPGNYPKFCGLEIVYSPHFPADWQGNAITCDFRAHRIVRFAIQDLGETAAAGPGSTGDSPVVPGDPPGTSKNPTNPSAKSGPPAGNSSAGSPTSTGGSPVLPALSGYVTKELPDLVRTADVSFRPIDVKLGPDGALYIADWSNPVINHGEVDFRDPRRDKTRGRIWRVSMKGKAGEKWAPLVGMGSTGDSPVRSGDSPERPEKPTPPSAEKNGLAANKSSAGSPTTTGGSPVPPGPSTAALLEKLSSPNLWEKTQARRVIATRSSDELHGGAQVMTEGKDLDAQREGISTLRSLGTLDQHNALVFVAKSKRAEDRALGVRLLGELSAGILRDYDDDVRLNRNLIIRDEPGAGVGQSISALGEAAKDAAPRVRVEAMRALARVQAPESASLVLEAALNQPGATGSGVGNARPEVTGGQFDKKPFSDTKDPHYGYAAWLSINDLAEVWTGAIASGEWVADSPEKERQLAWGLAAIRPELASATLARLVATDKVPLTGAGPWIELLGSAGGPGELARLFARAGSGELRGDAPVRALRALASAARLRSVRPSTDLKKIGDFFYEKDPALTAEALRLAGLWKVKPAAPLLTHFAESTETAVRDGAIEGLREMGGPEAIAGLSELTAENHPAPVRRMAAGALAALDLPGSLGRIAEVLTAQPNEAEALDAWRMILSAKAAPDTLASALPRNLPKPVATAGLKAARELGKKGEKLATALTPLAGAPDMPAGAQDYKALAALTVRDGDPARGEEIYRRTNLACVTCHAIGGAGGKVGPELTSLGASAPLDYIIESMLDPRAKVKEGYNAVTLTLKDGTAAMGIQVRETAQEVFLRNAIGQEQPVPKANITARENIGSIMPAGLVEQLQPRERLDLYAFLGQLGKPGVYDASKGNVARLWWLASEPPREKGVFHVNAAVVPVPTLVDGRLTKALLTERLPMVTERSKEPWAVARFTVPAAGKVKLNLTGITKATLDNQPLAIASEPSPSVELTAGEHALAVQLDPATLPDALRVAADGVRFLTE